MWTVYILQCRDGTLYTGITDNLPRRLAAHNGGKGAKYTRGRGPVVLVHQESCPDRSAALRRERAIKALSRSQKLALCHLPDA
ncbi:MAG: GIY-YIG nuclease family protein [Oscillospiraceae bacterium]|mgnify:FL=1|jgi:predicted GIY-YIG superfamily endonuclease